MRENHKRLISKMAGYKVCGRTWRSLYYQRKCWSNEIILNKKKYVEGKFNVSDKKSILQKGDVLTNIVGASIGRTAIFNLDDLANINQAVCILRCKEEILHNLYLSYLFEFSIFSRYMAR